MSQKMGRRSGERTDYIGVGLGYADIGETTKAIECYTKALNISAKESNFASEAILLENLGDAWLDFGDTDKAIDYYNQAIRFANKINYSETKIYARWGLAQAYLARNDLSRAYDAAFETLDYDLPTINHNLSVMQGIITLLQNDMHTAQTAFQKAVAQADIVLQNTPSFYEALDAKGLALCGLGLIEDKNQITFAKDSFHSARKITSNAAGIIKRTLRLFDEIVKADTDGVLLEVRPVIEGK